MRHFATITGFALLLGSCAGKQTPTVAPVADSESPIVTACKGGSANSCLRGGHDAEQAGDAEAAADLYSRACELGEASGCALAGGVLAAHDSAAAVKLFARGCELQDATACYGEGLVLVGRFGGEPDPAAAAVPFEKACALGLAAGCGDLANLSADPSRAESLRRQACEQGDGESCTRLGLDAWKRRDGADALSLFERSCATELPDPHGCGYLGWLVWSDGERPDRERGVALLDASCEAGSAIGCSLRASVHSHLGEASSAKALLERACELEPANCEQMTQQVEAAQAVKP